MNPVWPERIVSGQAGTSLENGWKTDFCRNKIDKGFRPDTETGKNVSCRLYGRVSTDHPVADTRLHLGSLHSREKILTAKPLTQLCRKHTFFLRHQYHHNKALQAEWNTHGEEAFQYEIIEKLDEDLPAIGVSDVLKEKKRDWVAQLGARTL